MKITLKDLGTAADASSAKGTAFRELWTLLVAACVLAVIVYFAVGFIVDLWVPRISYAREAQLFKGLSRHIGKADAPSLQRAQTILDDLLNDPEIPPLSYRLVLIDNDQINAFAFPGGTIGITRELLGQLNDDMALAFVLGHELGHFYHRDHLRGFGRAIGVGTAYAILFGGQMGNDSLGQLLQSALHRNYSRQQERLADRFSVSLVYRIYGRTEGVDELFRLINIQDKTPPWAYMFATHPQPERRIEELKHYAQDLHESQ